MQRLEDRRNATPPHCSCSSDEHTPIDPFSGESGMMLAAGGKICTGEIAASSSTSLPRSSTNHVQRRQWQRGKEEARVVEWCVGGRQGRLGMPRLWGALHCGAAAPPLPALWPGVLLQGWWDCMRTMRRALWTAVVVVVLLGPRTMTLVLQLRGPPCGRKRMGVACALLRFGAWCGVVVAVRKRPHFHVGAVPKAPPGVSPLLRWGGGHRRVTICSVSH